MSDRELAQIVWEYMFYQQPLQKADVIIGLGCHDIGVARYAASLYLENYAPLILFCGANGRMTSGVVECEADWFADEAMKLGVPDEKILRERRSTNTGENIRYAYGLLRAENITLRQAIIVHKPYMLRRDYATVMKQWPEENRPSFIFSAEQVSMDEYVKNSESFDIVVNIMLGDLQRVREYPALGFQIEQDIPEEVWSAFEQLVARGYDKQLLMK